MTTRPMTPAEHGRLLALLGLGRPYVGQPAARGALEGVQVGGRWLLQEASYSPTCPRVPGEVAALRLCRRASWFVW